MAHRERISWSFTGSPSGKLRKPRAATVLARALPRRGSFCNLSNGNTASLAPWWLNFLSLSLRSSSLAPSIRRVARRAICVLQTLETRGTVREYSTLGVPAHICAVGLYFMGCPVHSVPAQPHKTAPQCRPKGSLSLTQKPPYIILLEDITSSEVLYSSVLSFQSLENSLLFYIFVGEEIEPFQSYHLFFVFQLYQPPCKQFVNNNTTAYATATTMPKIKKIHEIQSYKPIE